MLPLHTQWWYDTWLIYTTRGGTRGEIQDWITLAHKVHISRTALHVNIHDAKMTFKLLCRAAAEHNEDLWEEWKQDVNAHFTASQMIFIDETSKDDWTIYWHYGCLITGSHAMISANFVWGEWYSIVTALSLDGYEAVDIVLGSADGEGFMDFIVNDMVHCTFYLSRFLLNHMPAAEDESLPSGQEHSDPQQLCNS